MTLDDLQQEAAALSPEERLRLAAFLRSLDGGAMPSSRKDDPLFHPGRLMGADESKNRQRVRLPLLHTPAGTVINPTKDELDASLWD